MTSPIKSPLPVRPLYISSESPETSDSLSSEELEGLTAGLCEKLMETSLSPRCALERLIQSEVTVGLCRALIHKLYDLTTTELIVFIWVFVQQSHLADESEELRLCLMVLAKKICKTRCLREAKISELLTLLSTVPSGQEIVDFLRLEDEGEPDKVEPEFLYKTWTALAKIFNGNGVFERLALEDIFISYSASSWLESTAESPNVCIYSLLLVYYMCDRERPEHWDFQSLSIIPSYQHFVLGGIRSCENLDNAWALFLKFNAVFAEEGWPLISGLSCQSFGLLEDILTNCSLADSAPEICLAILENHQIEPCRKLLLVHRELNTWQYLDVKFLDKFFALIFPLLSYEQLRVQDVVKQIIDDVFARFWVFSYIDITCESLKNLYSVYFEGAYEFLNNSLRRVIEVVDEEKWESFRETALEKVIFSVTASLERFANSNKMRVVPDYYMDTYINTLLTIKEVSFQLIFSLYRDKRNSSCKKIVFALLMNRLPKIFVIDPNRECVVQLGSVGSQKVLYFYTSYEQFSIENPL